ncbi:MAG: hypothetical protein ACK55Z_30565, partial [bacterium]
MRAYACMHVPVTTPLCRREPPRAAAARGLWLLPRSRSPERATTGVRARVCARVHVLTAAGVSLGVLARRAHRAACPVHTGTCVCVCM